MYKPEPCKCTNMHLLIFLMESQTKHSSGTVCPHTYSLFLFKIHLVFYLAKKSLRKIFCQNIFPPFDYTLNHYQLTFYCPITVLKFKIQDQENLIAFSTLRAEEKSTH